MKIQIVQSEINLKLFYRQIYKYVDVLIWSVFKSSLIRAHSFELIFDGLDFIYTAFLYSMNLKQVK